MAVSTFRSRFGGLQRKLNFNLRWYIGAMLLALAAVVGCLLACVFSMTGRRHQSGWAATPFTRLVFKYVLGIDFRITSGAEYLNGVRPAVLVGNHQTDLDIIMLSAIWPRFCSVVAKKETADRPFIGLFVRLCHTVFVCRNDTTKDIPVLDEAAETIRREKQSVFLFAEGTRGRPTKPALLPFKKGAFCLAVKANVPILPVVTEVYDHVYSRHDARFKRGEIHIRVLPPVSTDGLSISDVDNLIKSVRGNMLKALEDMAMARQT